MREHCPNCGSSDLVMTNGSYSCGCGCLGLLLFGWIGLLLGLLGLGNYELVCKHCGSRWPVGKPHRANRGGCSIFLLLIILIIIILAGCQMNKASLVGAWVLKDARSREVPTLFVAKDGSFYGFGGVNRYFGKLAVPFEDGKFALSGTTGMTMMFGPDLDKEQDFLKNLTTADRWQINDNGELQLCKADKVLAVFTARTEDSAKQSQLNNQKKGD